MAKEDIKLLESGDISFYVRHKVISPGESMRVRDQTEVQNLYIVLQSNSTNLYRLLIVGKKELPSTEEHEKNLIIVDVVTKENNDICETLKKDVYDTSTSGERIQPEAVVVADGIYSITLDGKQTFFNYNLSHTNMSKKFMTSLNIANHGNYVLSVKNPELILPDDSKIIPAYPNKFKKIFKGLHFIAAYPIELINYVNAQVIFIGISS